MRQGTRSPAGQPCIPINSCSRRHPRRKSVTRPRKYAQWNPLHNGMPILPSVQLCQIICPHEPDKPHARVSGLYCRQRFRRIAKPKLRLDITDHHARMAHNCLRRLHSIPHWCGAMRFQRITRTDQPDDTVQPEPPQGLIRDMHMSCMGRVK